MSIAELETLAPNFAWKKFLAETGLPKVGPCRRRGKVGLSENRRGF